MPVEIPAHSFNEQFLKPTSMLYRNLGAFEVEETLRANLIDGAVLMGGCDKSTPALVMGAISMGLPFILPTRWRDVVRQLAVLLRLGHVVGHNPLLKLLFG